ncbi:hypothetical protein Bca52824_032935 [Brassica carinata]|uniref:Uncharacterized protein n=1 Tax=Brassica carinata TaxID=52824 RepID=A0A8X7SHU6_BRACI|nr:hypothetical protein Bca52824_032935 [Brassica carinata]
MRGAQYPRVLKGTDTAHVRPGVLGTGQTRTGSDRDRNARVGMLGTVYPHGWPARTENVLRGKGNQDDLQGEGKFPRAKLPCRNHVVVKEKFSKQNLTIPGKDLEGKSCNWKAN